MKQLQLNISMK